MPEATHGIDWFREDVPSNVARAAAVCHECQLQRECLVYAGNSEYGIWGGLTRSKRIKLRRKGGPLHKCGTCGSLNTYLENGRARCGECGTVT